MALDNQNLIVAVDDEGYTISINNYANIWLIDEFVTFVIDCYPVRFENFMSSVIKKLLKNDPKFKLCSFSQLLELCRYYLQKQHVNTKQIEQFNKLSSIVKDISITNPILIDYIKYKI